MFTHSKKRGIIVAVIMLLVTLAAGCSSDTFGPDRYARKHLITTNVESCPNLNLSVQVSWVNWNWQAIYLRGAQQVANVTDSTFTKSSGCIYTLGDKARVELMPLGDIKNYLDPVSIDLTVVPGKTVFGPAEQ